jgi:hypothetical protein
MQSSSRPILSDFSPNQMYTSFHKGKTRRLFENSWHLFRRFAEVEICYNFDYVIFHKMR